MLQESLSQELEQARAEAQALRAQIERANREYYILDNPTLSDDEYDASMRRLVARTDCGR